MDFLRPSKRRATVMRAAVFVLFLLLAGMGSTASAQGPLSADPESAEQAADTTEPAIDPFGRTTPRGTVTGLLDAFAQQDTALAAQFLSLEGQDGIESARIVAALQEALNEGGALSPYTELSTDPPGNITDGLDADVERVGSFDRDGRPILLRRTETEDGEVWLVAPETLAQLNLSDRPIPAEMMDEAPAVIAGAPLIDWVKLLGLLLLVYLVIYAVLFLALKIAHRLSRGPRGTDIYQFLKAAAPPVGVLATLFIFRGIWDYAAISIVAKQTLLRHAGVIGWIAFTWFLLRLVDALAAITTARMHRSERRQAATIVTFVRRGIKVILLIIATIAVLDTIGLDVTTSIAALGIGGLALALGAQKTIENLVGSVMLILDRPFQVGDFTKIGDVLGTVEDIGMRSTLIRTNPRTVVSIPNGDLASRQVENFATRDRFLFHQTLGMSYDTDAGQMEILLERLRAIVAEDTDIIDDGARVRFLGFGESALNIELFLYFETHDYPQSLTMQEALLFRIMRLLEELAIEVAFPTRTLHVKTEAGPT